MHISRQCNEPGEASDMALERRRYTPRTVGELPRSALTPQFGDQAQDIEAVLFAQEPSFHEYRDQARMQHVDVSPLDDTTPPTSQMNPPSTNDDAQSTWRYIMPEALFPPCQDYDLEELQSSALSDPLSPMSAASTSPSKKKGGRAKGFRFSHDDAKNTKQVRKDGSCWHCFYMRKRVRALVL
jgi:hypothetical protein